MDYSCSQFHCNCGEPWLDDQRNWATIDPKMVIGNAPLETRAHNLPDWSVIGDPCISSEFECSSSLDSSSYCHHPITKSRVLTSHPCSKIRLDLQFQLLQLLDPVAFENFLMSEESREIFRSWLERNHTSLCSDSLMKFDQWNDEFRLGCLTNRLKQESQTIYSLV
ncbi:hypothetical protein O181_021753 [Austropuccinia psidii MF-1]|uniref:RGS domain-containing protein n=1 Tax=Austropuccinia psidii MF-1 TaxID=1389203 RepID=A0A9Q3CFH4_9BASI|nr:hypothetical protein [Austropuccinia psidii MF-1]